MRRWLALILLVLLPLQATWAAAARYCEHAAGAGATHVGHHDHGAHGHATPAADDTGAEGDAPTSDTAPDCGHCHGLGSGLVDRAATAWAPQVADAPAAPADRRQADHAPEQPERPQWARLA